MANTEVQLDDVALHALLRSRSGPVGRHLFTTGKTVEGVAKGNTPVDTGRLRSSLTTALFEVPYSPYLACRVGTDVDYATYVHEGTKFMSGRPFLVNALHQVVGY